MTLFMPDAHTLLTVVQTVDLGRPTAVMQQASITLCTTYIQAEIPFQQQQQQQQQNIILHLCVNLQQQKSLNIWD
jgi:hypothetical protein